MLTADQEWETFLKDDTLQIPNISQNSDKEFVPKVTPIYISTQTKIGYLNQPINLKDVFWEIPVIPYQNAAYGVIKKQIKKTQESGATTIELHTGRYDHLRVKTSIARELKIIKENWDENHWRTT